MKHDFAGLLTKLHEELQCDPELAVRFKDLLAHASDSRDLASEILLVGRLTDKLRRAVRVTRDDYLPRLSAYPEQVILRAEREIRRLHYKAKAVEHLNTLNDAQRCSRLDTAFHPTARYLALLKRYKECLEELVRQIDD